MKKILTRKQKTWVRGAVTLLLFLIFLLLNDEKITPQLQSGEPPTLFCTDDRLDLIYQQAIMEAQRSIVLFMYSLSDDKILHALNKKAKEGIEITVIHDPKTGDKKRLSKKINNIPREMPGLMHRKILVVDEERVWLGSANFTSESLKVHDNLVTALICPALAETLIEEKPGRHYIIGGQRVDLWRTPEEGEESLQRLIELIDGARSTIRVAMFTWTHHALTQAVIRAHKRGVKVEIALDQVQAQGSGSKAYAALKRAKIPLFLSSGNKFLHHKFAWIDGEILVNGSANWTHSAFTRNADCFLILYELNEKQCALLHKVWQILMYKQHFAVFGQRPMPISDHFFEMIDCAA